MSRLIFFEKQNKDLEYRLLRILLGALKVKGTVVQCSRKTNGIDPDKQEHFEQSHRVPMSLCSSVITHDIQILMFFILGFLENHSMVGVPNCSA